MNRYHSIDIMRAMALMVMVPCHFLLYFSPYNEFYFTFFGDFLSGLAAPLFLFLVGISQAVSQNGRPPSTEIFDETGTRMLKRASAIFLFGIFVDFTLEGSVYEWGVLSLIAASTVVLCLVRSLRTPVLLGMVAVIYAVTPFIRGTVGYLDFWTPSISPTEFSTFSPAIFMDPLYDYARATDPTMYSAVKGFLVAGYFPIFPWVLFPIFGLAMGKLLYGNPVRPLMRRAGYGVALSLILVGVAMVNWAHTHGTANIESGFLTTLYFFPLTPPWILIQIGFCLMLTLFLRSKVDHPEIAPSAFSFYQFLSKYSLTVYSLHYIIAYWTPQIVGYFTHEDQYYLGHLVGAPSAVLLAIVAIIGFYFLFIAWEKVGGKLSCGWFVQQLSSDSHWRASQQSMVQAPRSEKEYPPIYMAVSAEQTPSLPVTTC